MKVVPPAFALEPFRDYLALEAGNSPHTVANYLRDIRRFALYVSTAGAKAPTDVSGARIRDFVYSLKDLGLTPATIRRQISALRTYYRFLIGEGPWLASAATAPAARSLPIPGKLIISPGMSDVTTSWMSI